jgi:hypothetical protein
MQTAPHLFHIEHGTYGSVEPLFPAESIQGPDEQDTPTPVRTGCVPEQAVVLHPLHTTSAGNLLAVDCSDSPPLRRDVGPEVPFLTGEVLVLGRNP